MTLGALAAAERGGGSNNLTSFSQDRAFIFRLLIAWDSSGVWFSCLLLRILVAACASGPTGATWVLPSLCGEIEGGLGLNFTHVALEGQEAVTEWLFYCVAACRKAYAVLCILTRSRGRDALCH